MTTNTTLFAQILPMFTPQTERVATEALRHILEQSQAARDALEHMLRTAGAEVGSLTRFQTEAIGEEGERVDLVCYDGDGTERVLIEAKFKDKLTDKQPNTYWQRLSPDTPSALVFVAPDHRLHNLESNLTRRLAADRVQLGEEDRASNLISFPDKDSQRLLILISWDELLRRLEKAARANDDYQTSSALAKFRAGLSLSLKTDYNGKVKNTNKEKPCLCGCGHPGFPFRQGHEARAKRYINRARQSLKPDHRPNSSAEPVRLPKIMVEKAITDAYFNFAGFTADDIIELGKKVGVR